MANRANYQEDSTMREVHRIQHELERQFRQSGLSYLEWLQVTEPAFSESLAENGFKIITRGSLTFLEKIKPRRERSRRNGNTKKSAVQSPAKI